MSKRSYELRSASSAKKPKYNVDTEEDEEDIVTEGYCSDQGEISTQEQDLDEELVDQTDKRCKTVHRTEMPVDTVGNLDVSDLPTMDQTSIQSIFKIKPHYKNILVIDIGSSFSKSCIMTKSGREFVKNPVEFQINEKPLEFARTILYYSKSTSKFSLRNTENSVPVESIKKLFTVMEAQHVVVDCEKLLVTDLMKEFITQLIQSISLPKDEKGKLSKTIDCFIFTIPTSTPLHIKQHYKHIVEKSIKNCFTNTNGIQHDDIYVIEEFSLLFNADVADSDGGVSLIVDIGHMTADSTLVRNETITYANGEVGGVSIIHSKIEENGFNSFEVMGAIYKNIESDSLPSEYIMLDPIIRGACKEITIPLLDVILQNKPSKVYIYGAFVSSAYFRKILYELLNSEQLNLYIQNNRFIRDEFKSDHEFTVSCLESGGSALLLGAKNMVNKNRFVQLDFKRELEPSVTYPAFLFYDTTTKQNKLGFGKIVTQMFFVQEFEVFLVKIRNTIDIDKLFEEYVDIDNYKDAGIMEFERFATTKIIFREHGGNPHFALVGNVSSENVNLNLYYYNRTHYYVHRFLIPRKGRMERIPVNDISVVFGQENENCTWYGTEYQVELLIRSTNMNRIPKPLITELDDEDFKEILQSKGKKLEAMAEGDEHVFEERCKMNCIQCKAAVNVLAKDTHTIGERMICKMRKAFNDNNIVPGSMCHSCFKAYRRFYKI